MTEIRKLRLLVRTARGALPAVVAASVVPASSCSSDGTGERTGGTGGTSGAGASAAGSSGAGASAAGSSGAGAAGSTSGGAGAAGAPFGGGAGGLPLAGSSGQAGSGLGGRCEFTVELPPEGVPAEPGQICAATVSPVDSNRAAQVRFVGQPLDPTMVSGFIDVAPALIGLVVGTPTIEALEATDPALLAIEIDSIAPGENGFTFRARWPGQSLTPGQRDDLTRVTIRVTLEVACEDAPQLVHAVTDIHLCNIGVSQAEWVSSGSVCSVCRIIAEMAPSPIVPDQHGDELPLSRVLRLRIVELARVSGTVVLLAEHDGGPGLEYEWHASVGRVQQLAADVIALTADEGVSAPFVQVAAFGSDTAAVASWAFNAEVA